MKKGGILLLAVFFVVAAIALPFIGGRELVRGHDRGWFLTALLTVLGSILLIFSGAAAATAVDFLLQAFFRQTDAATYEPRQAYIALAVAIAAAVGLLVGLLERPTRMRSIAVATANEAFLDALGIVETGNSDVTHLDAQGTRLRLLETNARQVIFMVVGRRGKRAFIDLAPDGRMLSYSGASQ